MNADDDFETRIVVKSNMPDVLHRELGKPSWMRERVSIGTATDPYQPCEGRFRLTRRCLEALSAHETPVSVITKSTLVLRDLDVLTDLARRSGATVYFTVTTLDPGLWRRIEPGTPPPHKRLEVMRRPSEAGVSCGVFLAPILPGITDSVESIEAVAAAAKVHGAVSFGTSVLRLAPLVKEHYLGFVEASFPHLLPRYERAYAGTNVLSEYQVAIERRVARIRERYGFVEDAMNRGGANARTPEAATGATTSRTGQLSLLL